MVCQKFIVLNKAEVDVFSKGYNVPKDRIFTSHLGYYDMLRMYGDVNKKKENYVLSLDVFLHIRG